MVGNEQVFDTKQPSASLLLCTWQALRWGIDKSHFHAAIPGNASDSQELPNQQKRQSAHKDKDTDTILVIQKEKALRNQLGRWPVTYNCGLLLSILYR